MNSLMIVGVESVAGAGLAESLAARYQVSGLSAASGVDIPGCQVSHVDDMDAMTIERQLQQHRPDRVIFCGQAARSSWDSPMLSPSYADSLALDWARAAAARKADFTFVSSDAVFAGPWMSHSEDDEHFSVRHASLRDIESEIIRRHPDALIVRTNVFGWSPCTDAPGFAEVLLRKIESGLVDSVDFLSHAAPVLATDLGRLIERAHDEHVCGILHLGGAERLSPYQFAERLAAHADCSAVIIPDESLLDTASCEHQRGETTLDCSRARQLLGVCMPLIEDGLTAFLAQRRTSAPPARRDRITAVA